MLLTTPKAFRLFSDRLLQNGCKSGKEILPSYDLKGFPFYLAKNFLT
jgi:hypothetical protein